MQKNTLEAHSTLVLTFDLLFTCDVKQHVFSPSSIGVCFPVIFFSNCRFFEHSYEVIAVNACWLNECVLEDECYLTIVALCGFSFDHGGQTGRGKMIDTASYFCFSRVRQLHDCYCEERKNKLIFWHIMVIQKTKTTESKIQKNP